MISPGDSRTVGELAALKWEYAEGRPELHTAVKLAMGGILQVPTGRVSDTQRIAHAFCAHPISRFTPQVPPNRITVIASHVYPSSSGHVTDGAARIALWVSDLFNTTSSELRPAAVALAEAQARLAACAEEAAAAAAAADAAAGIVAPPPPSPPPTYGIEDPTVGCPVRVANATLECDGRDAAVAAAAAAAAVAAVAAAAAAPPSVH